MCSQAHHQQKREKHSTIHCGVLECYADITVVRHPVKGSIPAVVPYLTKPLLNAGDGTGEHSTQALLDLFTIDSELSRKGDFSGLTIVMLGDLKNGRTVHSLARLLSKYQGVNLIFVSPESLKMPDDVKDFLEKSNNDISYSEESTLEKVLHLADVLYVTRLQKERFSDPAEYERLHGSFGISKQILLTGGAKEDMIIMHPLPRVGDRQRC